jgi:hypothetical protein
MAGGFLVAALGSWHWLNILGWLAFFGSFFVMLKCPEQQS